MFCQSEFISDSKLMEVLRRIFCRNRNRVRMSLRGPRQSHYNFFLVFVGTDCTRAIANWRSKSALSDAETNPSGLGFGIKSRFIFRLNTFNSSTKPIFPLSQIPKLLVACFRRSYFFLFRFVFRFHLNLFSLHFQFVLSKFLFYSQQILPLHYL